MEILQRSVVYLPEESIYGASGHGQGHGASKSCTQICIMKVVIEGCASTVLLANLYR